MKHGSDLSWAWQPDATTQRAITRGNRTVANAKRRYDAPLKQTLKENTMAIRKSAKKTTTAAKKPARTAAKKAAPKATGNAIALKDLLRGTKALADMDPRVARRKLRAADINGHDPRARWEFDKKTAAVAKSVLMSQ